MTYIVSITLPQGGFIERKFYWHEFETGFMDFSIARTVIELYPDRKYTRDNAGVIHFIDDVEIVRIEAV